MPIQCVEHVRATLCSSHVQHAPVFPPAAHGKSATTHWPVLLLYCMPLQSCMPFHSEMSTLVPANQCYDSQRSPADTVIGLCRVCGPSAGCSLAEYGNIPRLGFDQRPGRKEPPLGSQDVWKLAGDDQVPRSTLSRICSQRHFLSMCVQPNDAPWV